MSWKQALQAYSAARASLQSSSSSSQRSSYSRNVLQASSSRRNALADREELYQTVARAHLFGPPGYRLHPDSLSVLREVRWFLLQDGTRREQSQLLQGVLRLFSEADQAYLYDPVPTAAERQCLLLEQIQCIVEAKVSGTPLGARHYRYPLQSPQLAHINPDLSLLLLEEMKAAAAAEKRQRGDLPSSAEAAETREDAIARLDCAVGLASAGYPKAAIPLCTAEGFPYVIDRVVKLRRNGWRQAWALADAVPLDKLLSTQATDAGWLTGLLDAATRKFRASNDPTLHEWFQSFMRVYREEGERSGGHRRAAVIPLKVMETYLGVCLPAVWREAKTTVLAYNKEADASASPKLAMGRLMALLQLAQQPLEVLKLFYGDGIKIVRATNDGEEDGAIEGIDASKPLVMPQGEHLSEQDCRHPAVSNHTMMALAQVGLWQLARRYYEDLPPERINRHTHWCAVRMLVVSGDGVPVPRNDSTYTLCMRAVGKAAPSRLPSPWASFGDADAICEAVTLWAAMRADWERASSLAKYAPPSCRYIHLLAMGAALRASHGKVAVEHYRMILNDPSCSVKQVCLGLAMIANTAAAMKEVGEPGGDLTAAMCHDVVHTLSRLVQGSQHAMDELIRVLVEYFYSIRLQQHQQQRDAPVVTEATCSLVRQDILKSTIAVMQKTVPCELGWRVLLQVIQAVGAAQGLSMARAAPAMVSAGAKPEVAINFLCC